jgi:hypothetical protein
MTPIDTTILSQPVQGMNLRGATLADQLAADQPTLLVFLRHYG